MIKYYGARAHDFGTHQLDQLIETLIAKEVEGVQLAPLKIFKNIKTHADFILDASSNDIMSAFRQNNKHVHVLGCYLNHAHPSMDKALQYLKQNS